MELYTQDEIKDFAKNAKFRCGKITNWRFFNLGDWQICIMKGNKKRGATGGYRVLLCPYDKEFGIYSTINATQNHFASTLQEAREKAGELYFTLIRKNAIQ